MMVLLAAMLLVGCSHDVDLKLGNEIAVQTGVTGLQQNRIRSVNNIDSLRLKDIKIDAYYHDTETKYLDGVKLHYDLGHSPSAAWVFWDGTKQVHYYWPFEGSRTSEDVLASTLDFVGFCPFNTPAYITGTDYDETDGVSFTCNLADSMTNAAQATMPEYLIAVLDSQTLNTQTIAGGALPLSFKHPFALIRFVITAGSGTHVQVDSIGIAGLNTIGTCTYDGTTMSWGSYDGSATLSIEPANPLKYGTSYTVSDTMMVIPNDYGTKTLVVKGTWDDWTDSVTKNIEAEVSFDWQPGYIYTYNLTVTKYALKVDVQKFTEQW